MPENHHGPPWTPHFHNFHILTDSLEQAKVDIIHCCQLHWWTSCELGGWKFKRRFTSPHLVCVICHNPTVKCHMPHVTCLMSNVFSSLKCWSYLVEGLLVLSILKPYNTNQPPPLGTFLGVYFLVYWILSFKLVLDQTSPFEVFHGNIGF